MLFSLSANSRCLKWFYNELHLRDIELENTVNEVSNKVISLINMTHTQRDILYTQLEEFCFFRFLDSRFMFIIVIIYILRSALFM